MAVTTSDLALLYLGKNIFPTPPAGYSLTNGEKFLAFNMIEL
jgi:hypothetical protein